MSRIVPFVGVVSLLLGACTEQTVVIIAEASTDPTLGDRQRPLDGATVTIHDATGAAFDTAETSEQGRFRVEAPRATRIYAVFDREDYLPTSFTATSGTERRFPDIEEGTLFALSESNADEWRTLFAGCPGLEDEGGIMIGEMRASNLFSDETGENPIITTGEVLWITGDGQARGGCYLNETGTAYDANAQFTGETGLFLIPNVPAGVAVFVASFRVFETEEPEDFTFDVFMPEGGAIARFPTFVEFITPI